MLQVIHRVTTAFLLRQAGLKASEAQSGAVTLIQPFGSQPERSSALPGPRWPLPRAAGEPVFHEARAPSIEECVGVRSSATGRPLQREAGFKALLDGAHCIQFTGAFGAADDLRRNAARRKRVDQ